MRHSTAFLTLCLLAAASSAAADSCSPGHFEMELVGASSASHVLAKCLSSVHVALAADCAVSLTSSGAGGNFVPALWTPAAAAPYTYTEHKECPQEGAPVAPGAATAAARLAAIEAAFSSHIYGAGKAYPATLTYTAGKVVAAADSQAFTYVITEVAGGVGASLGDAANIKVLTDPAAAGLPEGTFTAAITTACGSGRYGLILDDSIQVCLMCHAGTGGDGSCAPCDAGTAKAGVGAGSCTACQAGTYAATGSSDCIACPQHTYSGAGASQCIHCPVGSYAWVPGSTGCLRCVAGVPKCSAGSMAGESCTNAEAASPGYSVLAPAQMASCGLAGAYEVPAYTTCASWKTGAVSLQWSLAVAGDCSVVARPITDTSCSDPGSSSYTYTNLEMRAYYQTTKSIRSLLSPGAETGGASAFLMSLDQSGQASKLSMLLFAATSTPSAASGATVLCNNTVTVAGGAVAAVAPATATACPAGSYYDAASMCPPCPAGSHCAGGTGTAAVQTPCAGNTYNPFLGQKAGAVCTTCPVTTPAYTSEAGAAYCTVPFHQIDCNDGHEWEPASLRCVPCRGGTFRAKGSPSLECQDCPIGQYSAAGQAQCSICPAGQYAPVEGLADQNPGNAAAPKCLTCISGSVALVESLGQTVSIAQLTPGATVCEACPAGSATDGLDTAASVCVPCGPGTYRSGDAAPQNNVCQPIPAGYKSNANSGATEIFPCPLGTTSYWTAGTRVPAQATASTACQPCAEFGANTFAPREGMASCLACQAGAYPTKSDPSLEGADQCSECPENTYRSFSTVSGECAVCGAGSEVGPSSRQACTLCRAGTYKPAPGTPEGDADFCTECPINMFNNSTGSATCEWCPRGYETHDTGSDACTACALGYYSASTANSSDTSNCVAAPAGSFVDTTAAYSYTLCPVGHFSSEKASDSCEPAPPGQFASVAGSSSCRTCQAGTYSSGSASACRSCQAGYYAPAGASQCSPCKPGFYTGTTRSGTCALCPRGKQCPTIATAAPKDCPRGYFSAKEGSRLCSACPANTFAGTVGSLQCTPCAEGTGTRGLVGQSACTAIRATTLRRLML